MKRTIPLDDGGLTRISGFAFRGHLLRIAIVARCSEHQCCIHCGLWKLHIKLNDHLVHPARLSKNLVPVEFLGYEQGVDGGGYSGVSRNWIWVGSAKAPLYRN